MRRLAALLALSLAAAAPATAQTAAPPPAPRQQTQGQSNPYQGLFTRWDGANREAMDAETGVPQTASEPENGAMPAWSPLTPRSQSEAVALGERVGAIVRAGDCAEGERLAREAGDFALVRAVREHCRRPD